METSTVEIVGREDELVAIDAVLEAIPGSGAAVLLIEGEAGIGKTSLCAIMRIDANVQFLVEETREDDGEEED